MAASNTSPRRVVRRTYLNVEALEGRQLLSGYQPTVAEQVFLERLNDARANPAAYGQSIGLDLAGVAPSQPLALHPLLIQSARDHARDMSQRGFFSHSTPEGVTAGQRVRNTGLPLVTWGESLIAGAAYATADEALRGLIVDAGVPDLGHRRHLLATDANGRRENLIGVGVVQNAGGPLANYFAVNTGGDQRTYLTGVVYRDLNGNARYDAGEGLGGVTVTASNGAATTTYQTGGYTLPLAAGAYTITAAGGSLAGAVSQTVTVGATNVRLNLTAAADGRRDENFVRRLYQTTLGRAPAAGEVAHWVGVMQSAGRDVVAHSIERSAEARGRLVRIWYANHLGRHPGQGEEQFWVGAMTNGATDEQVLGAILGSGEFGSRAAALYHAGDADADFMQGLYTQVLGRNANAAEVSAWVPHVGYLGRQGVINLILNSGEYRGRHLYNYYVDLLGRRNWPSQAEVAPWAHSGIDLATVRIIFKSSAEFYG